MKNIIGIIDYGAGNIHSITNALVYLGCETRLISDPKDVRDCARLVLPGVGSFIPAMKMLESTGFAGALRESDGERPLLGICLGMQLLFSRGTENGDYPGLGLIPGTVRLINAPGLLIPHMGWNELRAERDNPLVKPGDGYVYFVHSYMAECAERANMIASCDYGETVTAAVRGDGNVFGTQFHPEKSGAVGLRILERFVNL